MNSSSNSSCMLSCALARNICRRRHRIYIDGDVMRKYEWKIVQRNMQIPWIRCCCCWMVNSNGNASRTELEWTECSVILVKFNFGHDKSSSPILSRISRGLSSMDRWTNSSTHKSFAQWQTMIEQLLSSSSYLGRLDDMQTIQSFIISRISIWRQTTTTASTLLFSIRNGWNMSDWTNLNF